LTLILEFQSMFQKIKSIKRTLQKFINALLLLLDSKVIQKLLQIFQIIGNNFPEIQLNFLWIFTNVEENKLKSLGHEIVEILGNEI
jgi:hypothetical protein